MARWNTWALFGALVLCVPASAQHLGGGMGEDDCTSPSELVGSGAFAFDNQSATTGTVGQAEAACDAWPGIGIENDIWFTWTSVTGGLAVVYTTGGTEMNTKIALYAGSSCPAPGSALACSNFFHSVQSWVQFTAVAGESYVIQLGNSPGTSPGSGTFYITEESGSWGPRNVITTDVVFPSFVTTADIDGDEDMEVFSASSDKLAFYPNLGDGVFGSQKVISTELPQPLSLCVVDLDGDALVDVISNGRTGHLAWFKNLGGGAFGALQELSAHAYPWSGAVVADLDNDGDPDVLHVGYYPSRIVWYENQGGGTFSSQIELVADMWTLSVFAADLDEDGDLDVLAGMDLLDPSLNVIGGRIVWYENQGGGNFGSQQIITSDVLRPRIVSAADIDADGVIDVIASSGARNEIAWYKGLGGGGFGAEVLITSNAFQLSSISIVDVDNDGDQDVLSSGHLVNMVAWYENLGAGVFDAQHLVSATVDPKSIHTSDLDGDGGVDVLTASWQDNRISWHENLRCFSGVTSYCLGSANSAGPGVEIGAPGSLSIDQNDTDLVAIGGPSDQFAIFFYGDGRAKQLFGEGVRCVTETVYRLAPPVAFNQLGVLLFPLDLTSGAPSAGPGRIRPGSTWNFQLWYRDQLGGPFGFNLSNGLEITFCP
ncbi:MAG: VCBS repeat-containing protein [Planctomycetota bacterium]|nr:VCBS repeat-containing protein [Planctomycetota bacterium]